MTVPQKRTVHHLSQEILMLKKDIVLSVLWSFSRAQIQSYFLKVKIVCDPGKYYKSNPNTAVIKMAQFCH